MILRYNWDVDVPGTWLWIVTLFQIRIYKIIHKFNESKKWARLGCSSIYWSSLFHRTLVHRMHSTFHRSRQRRPTRHYGNTLNPWPQAKPMRRPSAAPAPHPRLAAAASPVRHGRWKPAFNPVVCTTSSFPIRLPEWKFQGRGRPLQSAFQVTPR